MDEADEDEVLDELNESEAKCLRYTWRLLGGDVSGSLPVNNLGAILRGFGKNPSNQEIQYLKYHNGLEDNSRLIYDDVVRLYVKCKSGVQTLDQMIKAFQVFDKSDTGHVLTDDLREVLMRLGEPLSRKEVEDMFKLADKNHTGIIKYADFCQLVMSDNRPIAKLQ